ncbi:MAG: pyrroline-5-carboxylate reductase [Synechococcales cyanobacterium T60_A2020_003]|nr:pyrroline-5-carboxylate reductase [Synechococcales cyanobacterium T60_A2020_003]
MATKLGIIGGGVMGEALLSRLLFKGTYAPTDVFVSDPSADRRETLASQYQVHVSEQNQSVVDAADVLLLAIKPQLFDVVIQALVRQNPQQLVLSILAGVPLARLESAFPNYPVIRAMPNTPATVGAGMTAIAGGTHTQPTHLDLAMQVFGAVGEVVEVPERLMDAVTGLSGSGPAYVALMVEALADGGVAAGLPRAIAQQLALQTVLGTAELLKASNLHPAELKDRVTSPGGTTIAGVSHLERQGFRSALIEAVRAAAMRSQELGRS